MTEAYDFLRGQSLDSLLALAWFFAIFEVPRYFILFALTAFAPPRKHTVVGPVPALSVSVVVVGHSEADKMTKCIASLREQSCPPDEIIVVSDGSTDDMATHVKSLARDGHIAAGHATDLRSGKAAGLNFGASQSKGDIIVFIDCDCTLERHAIRNMLRRFADPQVGAVAGSVVARNHDASLVTAFQAIEYLVTISLGKLAMDRLGLVSCVSGAFGGYRRAAFDAIGGYDAEGGEDLDITLSMRSAGYAVVFAEDAYCHTYVPVSLQALLTQRGRWERDAIRLRYRKHAHMMNPASPRFLWSDWLHEAEFLLFNVLAAIALPIYLVWIFATYGSFALSVLLAALMLAICADLLVFLMALAVTPGARAWGLLPYVPGFSLYYGVMMRLVRLFAYASEWMFTASNKDAFVPEKVRFARSIQT